MADYRSYPPKKLVPESRARVSCILVPDFSGAAQTWTDCDRTLFCSSPVTWNHVTQMHLSLVADVCLHCVSYYRLQINSIY